MGYTSGKVVAPPVPAAKGFLEVDLTGASGVYLTLSRNETDFTTFNLADPSFSPPEFGAWIGIGQNQNAGAFFDYPAILGDDALLSDVQGISGMTLAGNVITPRHGEGGYVYPSDSLAFGYVIVNKPFTIPPEYNTVTAKATPNVPAEQDIFYSLDGAVEGGTVTIVSHAVIQFDAVPATITDSNGIDVCNADNVGYYILDFSESGSGGDQKYPTFEALLEAVKTTNDYEPEFAGLLETEADSIYWTGSASHVGEYMIGERGAGAFVYTGSCNIIFENT